MSSTSLINQAVAEQRHASEQQASPPQQRDSSSSMAFLPSHQNVGSTERMISLTAGGIMAGLGLSRGGESGLAMLALGGALVFRGATGRCSVYHALGVANKT